MKEKNDPVKRKFFAYLLINYTFELTYYMYKISAS